VCAREDKGDMQWHAYEKKGWLASSFQCTSSQGLTVAKDWKLRDFFFGGKEAEGLTNKPNKGYIYRAFLINSLSSSSGTRHAH
jgi:hypothetical protein